MKRLSWLLIVGLCAFSALGADDLVVKNWVAGGTKGCSKKNIQLISNGDVFSLLFDSVRVELLENQKKDGFAKDAFCEVAILFEVPKGKCIDHLDQVLAGGVLKSTGSEGALRFLTFMNGKTPVNEKITLE